MDYEKAYKEMVQRARELHEVGNDFTKLQMEIVCPELEKSGDERIRDEILTLVKHTVLPDATCLVRGGTTTREQAEKYLEKLKDITFLSWRSVDDCGDIEDGHYVVVAYNRPGLFALDTVFKGKLSHPFIGDLKAISVFYIPNANEKCVYLEKQKVNTDGDFARGYDCGYECCLNSHGAEWFEKQKEKKHKLAPKWLYRLEYRNDSCGLWYNGSGEWCFEEGIGSIEGCKTKTLPMDYDERYKQDGRNWFSSCSKKEDLMHWYSLDDAKKLIAKGFVFTRYLATEYHEYEQQTVFIKDTALYREEIDIFELFDSEIKMQKVNEDKDAIEPAPMKTIVKVPGYIYAREDGDIDYEPNSEYWDLISRYLYDAGFRVGDDIVITISKTE